MLAFSLAGSVFQHLPDFFWGFFFSISWALRIKG
jgi:hypothetical protein